MPQLSISLMGGVQRLMTDLGGWQELLPIHGTPLMHTGHGGELVETEMITMLRRFFPEWQPA